MSRPSRRQRTWLTTTGAGLLVLVLYLLGRCTGLLPVSPTPTPYGTAEATVASTAPAHTATAVTARATATLAASQATTAPKASSTPYRATVAPETTNAVQPPAGLAIPTPLPSERIPTIRYSQLPSQAHDTLALIARGGPFPYKQDGVVFENREKLLPAKASGYYHEYTVVTPGSPDRGARRIIRGGQGELYYTADHYASFKRVIP